MPDTKPDLQHNAKARQEIIQKTFRQLSKLEEQRKGVTQEISELLHKVVKGDLNMKIGDFRIAYRLYCLEGKDRDEMLTTVRECFNAQGVGEQLDWLKMEERSQSLTTETVNAADEVAAAAQGPVGKPRKATTKKRK